RSPGRGRAGRGLHRMVDGGVLNDQVFSRSPEQAELVARVRETAREVLAPIARQGEPGRVNRPLVRALAEQDILPRLFPERAGGVAHRDVSAVELCLLREALAQGSAPAENALAMQGLGGYPILQSGSPEQIDRWVPA